MTETKYLKNLQKWMDSYLNFEKTPEKNIFWLDTMQFFCNRFQNPEKAIPCFHVAGSKGKGSVSTMIAAILDEAGFKTGIYTSPHIIDFIERVSTFGGYFSADVYDEAAKELMDGVESVDRSELPSERPITWFELVTLFAFLTFRKAKADYAVYEVGLGGRLDSTNVVTPLLSCITPIELEHTEFLGDTVEKIAYEKGGIIKENTPAVIAAQKESVKQVFRKIAEEKKSKLYFVDEISDGLQYSYDEDGMSVSFRSPVFKREIKTKLLLQGKFQAENAILASIAVKLAVPEIDEKTIERGLSKASLPARFEIVRFPEGFSGIPCLILDGAHTLNSIRFTMETFRAIFQEKIRKNGTKTYLLFGCAADKDVRDMAQELKDGFDGYFLTRPGEVKHSDLKTMKEAFSNAGITFLMDEDYKKTIRDVLEKAEKEKAIVLVTGSFYLVSEVKKILLEARPERT